jgi:hypothetical protein
MERRAVNGGEQRRAEEAADDTHDESYKDHGGALGEADPGVDTRGASGGNEPAKAGYQGVTLSSKTS